MENREDIEKSLSGLGWKMRADCDRPEVMGSYGKYHIMISFEEAEPTSVIISYVGKGGGMLSRKWPGVGRLPSPRKVVQALSKNS